ncbi:TonB-dependent receptor plug domain-containing protein [Ferruginibacter albus]|uniref:TonB-dependent receptor plug domain-containing protein n=1 Tax=Ferruginibacter albus TaxID=2875540 RepID=UPI001CC4514E|nr:TonB-dependent receptor plug domain-containing protein [Ferruginibacter albus]UAY51079.1 TonB-dependent receptor plug domain-containing protein [Ferruginibacter albus]
MRSFLLVLFLFFFFVVRAQKDTGKDASSLSDLSLDELLNTQVVTASGYLQTVAEAPSTITVITAQQIAERGYEQLEDALRDVPGIDMIHVNGYAPTLFYFRGMYGAENLRALLMIDGIVENNILGTNDMAGPVYSLHNIDHIEIIWGPASALYGANAFGGVINMISKKGQDINGLHAEKGYGTFNTSFEKLSVGLKEKKFEFAFAGTLYNTDGPKFTNRDPNYAASFVDNGYSFNGTISYNAEKSVTTLGYRTYNTPMGWGTYSNSPTVYLRLPSQGYGNSGVVGLLTSSIRGEKPGLDESYLQTIFLQNEYKPNEKWDILSRVSYRETGTADDSYVYVTADGNKLIRANIATYSNSVSGELSANYMLSEMHKFSAGVEARQDNVEQGSRQSTFDSTIYFLDGKDTLTNLHTTYLPRQYDIRNNIGSYLQYILNTNLLGKTNFTWGVRYDYNSYFGSMTSPRAVVVNQPNDKLTLKYQFGMAFRAPTNLEIHQAPPDFSLKTEKIKTHEVNIIYSFSKNVRAQLNFYRNELTDVIVLSNLSGFNANKNPGKLRVNGIEGVVDWVISKNASAFANFTYSDTRGENLITGLVRNVSAIPKIKGNAGVTVHVNDLFTFCITENMVGERPTPFTDPYGPVAGYALTNCEITTKKMFDNRVTASLNIKNIFDAHWLDPGFRTADGLVYSTVLEQPGRTALFKISIDLNN